MIDLSKKIVAKFKMNDDAPHPYVAGLRGQPTELVIDGSFENDADWTWGTNWSHNALQERASFRGTGTGDLSQSLIGGTTASKKYLVIFKWQSGSVGNCTPYVGGQAGTTRGFTGINVFYKEIITAADNSGTFLMRGDGTDASFDIDDISCICIDDYAQLGTFSDAGGDPNTDAHTVTGKVGGALSYDGTDDFLAWSMLHKQSSWVNMTGTDGQNNHVQDITTDMVNTMWWTHTRKIVKSTVNPCAYVDSVTVDTHSGGIVYKDGILYVAWSDGGVDWDDTCVNAIRKYDADTLEFIEETSITDIEYGIDALCYHNGFWYVGEESTPTDNLPLKIHKFDESWTHIQAYTVLANHASYGAQGLEFINGHFIIATYVYAEQYIICGEDFVPLEIRTTPNGSSGGFTRWGDDALLLGNCYQDPALWKGRLAYISGPVSYTPKIKIAVSVLVNLPYLPSEMPNNYARILRTDDDKFALFYRKWPANGPCLEFKVTTTEGGTPRVFVDEADLKKDQWMWIYADYDHDIIRVFVDNVQKGGDVDRDNTDAIMSDGWEVSSGTWELQGNVDLVMIFKDTLTEAERSFIYKGGNYTERTAGYDYGAISRGIMRGVMRGAG